MTPIFVYITTPDSDVARTIAKDLIDTRLIACANILPGMESIYRWEGKIERAQETVLLLKTDGDLFDQVAERVRSLHPYECPCIVSLELERVDLPFLQWLSSHLPSR